MPLPLIPKRPLSIARLFAIVAVWAVAFAWPYWFGAKTNLNQSWWVNALGAVLTALPIGLPLTLVTILGRRIAPWLVAGFLLGCAIAYYYLHARLVHTQVSYGQLAILFGGYGAGALGSGRLCYQRLVDRSWWHGLAWGIVATVCAGGYAFYIYLLRVL